MQAVFFNRAKKLTRGKSAIKVTGTQPCSSILDLKNSSLTKLASLQKNKLRMNEDLLTV